MKIVLTKVIYVSQTGIITQVGKYLKLLKTSQIASARISAYWPRVNLDPCANEQTVYSSLVTSLMVNSRPWAGSGH